MKELPAVTIGLAGAGYAARLHCCGYSRVHGCRVDIRAVADPNRARAEKLAAEFGIPRIEADFRDLLADPEIQIIDIVTPPCCHARMIEEALAFGKHVICEKPLTGYFGMPGDAAPVGKVSKQKMYDAVCAELERLEAVISRSDRRFCYAENFVYAPPLIKAAEILTAKKSKILFMRGEELLKGSSSALAGEWSGTGGGTLIRCGTHPLTALLYLKRHEAAARGENVAPVSVVCDAGQATCCLDEHDHRHISARPHDVEDFAQMVITFSDGTKASVLAADTCLGGTRNAVDIYSSDGVFTCNITPNDILNAYCLDEEGLDNVGFSEMLPAKTGWNKVFICDEVIRGYHGELQDFVEAVAFDREPESSFELAAQTTRLIYAAYLSAETGKKVLL